MAQPNVIVTLPHAVNALLSFSQKVGWIFRGQTNSAWPLLPKAGRKPFYKKSKPVNESEPASKNNPQPDLGMFNHWRRLAQGYSGQLPANDFECLAYAQHYGLPTRLLDFTENSLAALYFACESGFDTDGAVYAYCPETYVDTFVGNIYSFPVNACLKIPPFDRRILAQRAAFVYFCDPASALVPEPLEPKLAAAFSTPMNLVKIEIAADVKLVIHRQLQDVGMTRRTLFPDLDGLSQDFMVDAQYRAAFKVATAAKK